MDIFLSISLCTHAVVLQETFQDPPTYFQLCLFKPVTGNHTSAPEGPWFLGVLAEEPSKLLHDPPDWALLPSALCPDLCLSPALQEPDSDDEWQHLLEASKPTPIQLKAPLALLCNPDFCQRIQSQLQEAAGQVMGRRAPWRGFETISTDEALKNIDWHKVKEEFVHLQFSFSASA